MSEVRVEISEGVATITLNAPARRNALTRSLAVELIGACESVDRDPSVGAVVVAGEGPAFCAGADLALLRTAARGLNDDDFRVVYGSFARVGTLEVPTIAAVAGSAVGAGLNLALATDVRIVATDASLIPGFQRLGLHPGGGHFVLLARLAGAEAAAAIGLFGAGIDGARAVELGLAWEALPAAQVLPRAQELASRVARDPVLARRMASSFRAEVGPPAVSRRDALEAEAVAQWWSLQRVDARTLEP
jgi:enoyl-CoA hydratase